MDTLNAMSTTTEIFENPVGYLASFGIEAELIEDAPGSLPLAA